MYLNQPLQTYLDDLASARSTPGGGSASALSGAMGAGLAAMVTRLTIDKVDYAHVRQEMETLLVQIEQLRPRFQQLMQEDIDAYARLSATFKLPKETPEQRLTRTKAIQERLVDAALVPLEVAESAAQLIQYCQRIAEIGNVNVLSDIATGALLTASAGNGAAWMVRVNTRSLKNETLAKELDGRLQAALERIDEKSQQIRRLVEERG